MLNNKERQFVFTDMNNAKGFTFISKLLTLVIVMITLPFLVYFLSNIHSTSFAEDMSVEQFFVFIRNDALEAKRVYSEDNKLYFYLETEETAKIEFYSDVIRRQVDGRGHEIYLRNIASFTVEPLTYGSKIIVTTLKGETYEKTIAHYDE